ncbi:hypothetical protein RJ641_008215 [Dillenia turbinata]|uniref:Uncharacterized protein n=1 Tax=Dillenia turbinata TaxID=194707 RepID=A0AAN8VAG1_9MAGN
MEDQKSFLRCFSYKEIKRATNSFRNIVAYHPHGVIYKAKFRDGCIALVKEVRTSNHENEVFCREVQLLGRMHHRRLVGLTGFSVGSERFDNELDYKFSHEYLSFFCDPPIYHISISSSNMMLDDNLAAKISDVGLLCSAEKHVVEPHLSCSKGKIPKLHYALYLIGNLCHPTCRMQGPGITEHDFSAITGQSSEKGGADLIQWGQEPLYGRTIHKMIDPDLGNNYDSRELKSLLAVARLYRIRG